MDINNSIQHIYLAEIKATGKHENRPDIVKLATMMKDCVDHALRKGYDRSNTHVVGFLQEGTRSTVYFLNSPSNHFYCYFEVSTFSLPSNIAEMQKLEGVIEGLEKCRKLTINAAINLERGVANETDVGYDYRLTSKSPAHHAKYYS